MEIFQVFFRHGVTKKMYFVEFRWNGLRFSHPVEDNDFISGGLHQVRIGVIGGDLHQVRISVFWKSSSDQNWFSLEVFIRPGLVFSRGLHEVWIGVMGGNLHEIRISGFLEVFIRQGLVFSGGLHQTMIGVL